MWLLISTNQRIHLEKQTQRTQREESLQRDKDEEVGQVGGRDSGAQQAVSNLARLLLLPGGGRTRLRHRRLPPPWPVRPSNSPLNFPEYIAGEEEVRDISAATIRKKAAEVGARVDAIETAQYHVPSEGNSGRVSEKPDLNEYPNPEKSDGE
ncbi:related to AP2 1 [Actinidia rufa]|uniref:Related to AP2 1 n=1 Tax=Actinidia rufa TaxID=165716 RepID=A0A7J0E317_9ERIC|nr:related to AP2 1 [Actinidia rufa]